MNTDSGPLSRIIDWDDAYANASHIPRGEEYYPRWQQNAARFRDQLDRTRQQLDISYGSSPRERYDLFFPECEPAGVVVFVHGGYWMKLDKSCWSHLASGALNAGWMVMMPGYTLCPDIAIEDITCQIAAALTHLSKTYELPLRLSGHSAGGHLVTRMSCARSPLSSKLQSNIEHTLSISGVHDLRPLLNTDLNQTLKLDLDSAALESPALHSPIPNTRLTCWVGANERPEFIRQNALLANIWYGLGAHTREHVQPDRHHFDIIDDLANDQSDLMRALLTRDQNQPVR